MTSKKYLFWFGSATIFILALICLVNYIVDPFMQYRIKDGKYILNPRYVNPGLLKNYDYDYILMGSSMIQMFDMSVLKNELSVKPLKVSSGDMNLSEMELLYSLVKKNDVNAFLINLDLGKFNSTNDEIRYADYLVKGDLINKLRYFIAYETNRFTLPDIYFTEYFKRAKEVAPQLSAKVNIDQIGDYSYIIYTSKRLVITDYNNRKIPDLNGMYDRLCSRFDELMSHLEVEKYTDKEFTFFLPPYSAVYWFSAKKDGYYPIYKDFVKYMLENTEKYKNVNFICLYDSDYITELDTYSDMMHYSPGRVDGIMEAIINKDRILNINNVDAVFSKVDSLVVVCRKENAK